MSLQIPKVPQKSNEVISIQSDIGKLLASTSISSFKRQDKKLALIHEMVTFIQENGGSVQEQHKQLDDRITLLESRTTQSEKKRLEEQKEFSQALKGIINDQARSFFPKQAN